MRRRAIRLVGLWAIVLSTTAITHAVEYAGGTGTAEAPYLIATAEQFLAADFTVPETYFRLCNDIDLDGKGGAQSPFRAHLDGAGYRILFPASPVSLLGDIQAGATVCNLIVEEAAVGVGGIHAGPIMWWGFATLAEENNGTISGCAVSGWVASHEYVGGLVLRNRGLIRNCCFNGCVTTDWVPEPDDYPYRGVGGLAGYNYGSICASYATGVVFARGAAGGLVGENHGSITDCYAMTTVATDSGGGGLVGLNLGHITHCYAVGWVTGEMRGGLVGMLDSGGIVTSCLWDAYETGCLTSGGGIGVFRPGGFSDSILSRNGWSGEPNWVTVDGFDFGANYPRLIWEGIDGEPVSEYPSSPGSGTETNPYVITDEYHLWDLCTRSVDWDKHFILTADLDMASFSSFHSLSVSPIGVCPGSAFTGSFDGNGHTIRNVTINTEGDTAWNLGVFGYVTGQVKKLTVENIHFTSGQNSRCVGLLAGTCQGTIENCRASGSVTAGKDSQYVGGLVGYFRSERDSPCVESPGSCQGVIENCWAGGSVTVGEDSQCIGRLVGNVRRKATSCDVVINCEADVTIEAGEGSTNVGDLIGCDNNKR